MVKNRIGSLYLFIHFQVITYYVPRTTLDMKNINKVGFQFTPLESSQRSPRRQTHKQV